MTRSRPLRSRFTLVLLASLLLLLTACAAGDDTEGAGAASEEEDAAQDVGDGEEVEDDQGVDDESQEGADAAEEATTRTVAHHLGETEVPADPARIVSASVTMTGHLLAVDAPVVASGVTRPSDLADESGFFVQWADVAAERGIEPLPGGEIDVEAIAALEPDLIVGSAFGGDAVTEDSHALLSEIAPTIVFDHSSRSWQDLTRDVADAVGGEDELEAFLADYEAAADRAAEALDTDHEAVAFVPGDPANMNVFTPSSAHGRLLEDFGFAYRDVTAIGADSGLQGGDERQDVVQISTEQLDAAFGDASLMAVFSDRARLEALPAVDDGRTYALGFASFRLDPYSATMVAETLTEAAS
jgi:iron complex transport system substrate-binding protein